MTTVNDAKSRTSETLGCTIKIAGREHAKCPLSGTSTECLVIVASFFPFTLPPIPVSVAALNKLTKAVYDPCVREFLKLVIAIRQFRVSLVSDPPIPLLDGDPHALVLETPPNSGHLAPDRREAGPAAVQRHRPGLPAPGY